MRTRWKNVPWREGEGLPLAGEGWDGLRVGSEGCALLVPDPGWVEDAARRAGTGGGLSLVTPSLAPSEFPRVHRAALAALESGWGEVVVNDWGLLDLLSSPGRGRLTAGRLLMRARRGPGETDPWDGLDPVSRGYFAWGPLEDRGLLEVLGQRGVSRLEMDPPRHWHPLPSRPTGGLALTLHADNRLVTLAGNCPFLFRRGAGRWLGEGCAAACRERPPLLLGALELARPLLCWGRLVLEDARGVLPVEDLPSWVDRQVHSPNLFPDLP